MGVPVKHYSENFSAFFAVLTLFVIPPVEKLGTHFTLAPLTDNQKNYFLEYISP